MSAIPDSMAARPGRPVALVTGAARRVGRAIALRLAAAGYDVGFTYHRSEDDAQSLAEALDEHVDAGLALQADLTRPEEATSAIFEAVEERFGRLDVLVNNASLFEPGDLEGTTLEQVRRANAIHLESPLLLCQHFAPRLRAARGHVINLCDLLGERPWPHYLAYCASKAALANLTLGLARSLAPEVTVNGIAPGVVEWPDDYPPDERDKYLRRVPLARPGTPADVAEMVAFLCTGGTYVTGQIIRLDGGRSIT